MKKSVHVLPEQASARAEAFLERLRASPLLSRCRGPYPLEWRITLVPWQEAMDAVSSVLLDITPWTNIDKSWQKVTRDVNRISRGGALIGSVMWWLGLSSLNGTFRRIDVEVGRILRVKSNDWKRHFPQDWAILEDYVCTLIETAARVVALDLAKNHPTFMRVIELILTGYLPVDFNEDADGVLFVFPEPRVPIGSRSK